MARGVIILALTCSTSFVKENKKEIIMEKRVVNNSIRRCLVYRPAIRMEVFRVRNACIYYVLILQCTSANQHIL